MPSFCGGGGATIPGRVQQTTGRGTQGQGGNWSKTELIHLRGLFNISDSFCYSIILFSIT